MSRVLGARVQRGFMLSVSQFGIILQNNLNYNRQMLLKTYKQIEANLEQWEIDDETRQKSESISIKTLQAKFLIDVNERNSSIVAVQNKFLEKTSIFTKKRARSHFQVQACSSLESNSVNSSLDCQKTKKQKKRKPSAYKILGGEVVSGRVHGKSTLEMNNGCIFEGTVEYGVLKQGDLKYPNGAIYKGGFQNELPNGPGKLSFPSGTEYRTVFKNGEPTGNALIIYGNGDIYKGPIFRLKKHGIGKLLFKNGDKYVGDFKFGEITGLGTYFTNQKAVATGRWMNGELISKQRVYHPEDPVIEF